MLTDFYSRMHWQVYLLEDWWGTKVWKKTTEVITPLGFKLTSDFNLAYKMMLASTFNYLFIAPEVTEKWLSQ